jgi:hypothetical protein
VESDVFRGCDFVKIDISHEIRKRFPKGFPTESMGRDIRSLEKESSEEEDEDEGL